MPLYVVLFSNLMSLFFQLFNAGDRASGRGGGVYRVCMHNQIGECGAVRHWRMSGLTFTPLLRSIPRAPVVIHPVKVEKR